MKSIHKDPNRVLFPKSGNGLASSLGSHSTGGGAAASILSKKRLTLPFLVLLAALAVGMLFLLPGGLLQAQESSTIEYAENGKDPVATFTAMDPEGATPVYWSLLTTGTPGNVVADDYGDAADFMIDEETGELKFNIAAANDGSETGSPDFENGQGSVTDEPNTYKVVVVACDVALTGDPGVCPDAPAGQAGYHKVTVKVTNVEEAGKVAWTVDPDGDGGLAVDAVNGGMPIMQFQVGATLAVAATATATSGVTDGDVPGATKDVNERLQWSRSSSMTGMGTPIDEATGDSYTVTTDDIGMYIRVDVFYNVGTGREESASLTSDYPVLADRGTANDEPEFSPASVTRDVNEGMKGMTVGAPVRATDDITNALNYTLGAATDADNGIFKIDQKTGQITTRFDLDREAGATATADTAGACSDTTGTPASRMTCVVNVTATDSAGGASTAATVTINITNVDEKPKFSTGSKMVDVAEGMTVVDVNADDDDDPTTPTGTSEAIYTAMDEDGRSLTYNLMGADGAKFQLTASRYLSFRAKPDYEMPTDANKDNVYEVTVRASDGTMYADRMVMVTVTDVDEAPEIMGKDSVAYAENGTDPVETFTAMDPEGATPIYWSLLTTGTPGNVVADDYGDAADFMIDEETGELKFNIATANEGSETGSPDFENGQGSVTDEPNTYKVVVVACDVALTGDPGVCPDAPAGQAAYHKVTVKVTKVAEKGKVTWTVDHDGGGADTPKLLQFQPGAILTATASDGDITDAEKDFTTDRTDEVIGVTWRWYKGSTRVGDGADTAAADYSDNDYTVQVNDVGSRIRVEVYYTLVGEGNREENASLTSDYAVLRDRGDLNEGPEFSPASITREVSEGKKGRNVGTPVRATDDITNALNYTLGAATNADNGIFKIDQKTGQITTRFDLDREADAAATATTAGACSDATGTPASRMTCVVNVTATDSAGDASTAATVTINITNVDEKPKFTSGFKMRDVAEGMTQVDDDDDATNDLAGEAIYIATDEDGLNVNLSLMGPDAAKFQLNAVTTGETLSFRMKPDYEMPTDANGDNVYEVTVRASDGTMNADRMVKITVTDVDEPPVIMEGGLTMDGMSAVSVDENTTDVGTYMVAGPEASSATWTLEGADMGDFRISGSGMSAMLRFIAAPDYETPADANGDNVYMVTVKATDSEGNMATMRVTVTVDDVTNEQLTLMQRYDDNRNGKIDLSEARAAVGDYFAQPPTLTEEQIREIVGLYFAGLQSN